MMSLKATIYMICKLYRTQVRGEVIQNSNSPRHPERSEGSPAEWHGFFWRSLATLGMTWFARIYDMGV